MDNFTQYRKSLYSKDNNLLESFIVISKQNQLIRNTLLSHSTLVQIHITVQTFNNLN